MSTVTIEVFPRQIREGIENHPGYIAQAVTDDGRFLADGEGDTQDRAVLSLQDNIIAAMSASECAKGNIDEARRRVREFRQERHVITFEHMSDSELGHLVRTAMQQNAAEQVRNDREARLRAEREEAIAAKVKTLVTVLGITEAEALKKVQELA